MRDRASHFRGRALRKGYGAHMDSLIASVSKKRGETAEKKVMRALAALKEKGVIHNFIRIPENGYEQHMGIDFKVFAHNGKTTPIQVKSGFTGAKKHRARFPDIPVIIILPGVAQTEIESTLCRLLHIAQPPT